LTQDNVDVLAGWIYSPNAIASAPIVSAGKKLAVIMNAGTAHITNLSPYYVRTSFSMWHAGYALGEASAKILNAKTAVVGYTDFPPGKDSLAAFKRFFEAWKKEYGASTTPDFMAVGGYDGMAAIVHVVQALKGKVEVDAALEALKGWKFASPRGPIMIDPVTRDIVMNEYLSEAVMKDGRVFQKVIGKIDGVKDAYKEQKIG